MKRCRLYKRLRNPKAFTLVELVLVIALMAILSAAVLPSVTNRLNTANDEDLNYYFETVQYQVGTIRTTYNDAMQEGQTPVLAGYFLTTARNIQECLRAANNHSKVFDIEVRTVNVAPDPNDYNYIDTIVVCIQFYTKDKKLIVNGKGVACSPEQATNGAVAYSCKVVKIWYVKKDLKSRIYRQGGAMS